MVPFFILHQFFWGLKSFYFSTSPNIIWLFALKKRELNRHYEYQLYKRIDAAIFCPIKSLIQTVPVLTTSVSSVWGEKRRPTDSYMEGYGAPTFIGAQPVCRWR